MILAAAEPLPLWSVLLAAFVPVIAIVVTHVLNRQDRKTKAAQLATQVESTKSELAGTVEVAKAEQNAKLHQIEILVDGRLTEALREIAELKRKFADLRPHDTKAEADATSAAAEVVRKSEIDEVASKARRDSLPHAAGT